MKANKNSSFQLNFYNKFIIYSTLISVSKITLKINLKKKDKP